MTAAGPVPDSVRVALVWRAQIAAAAACYALDPALVAAVVYRESAGDPSALRVERGFWLRYGAAIRAFVRRSRSTYDDRWLAYPDIFSASYGLMQVLYQVALENGFDALYPTALCVPEVGLDVGCRVLAAKIRAAGTVSGGLLRYNGGGRPAYADEVLSFRKEIASGGVFDGVNQAT